MAKERVSITWVPILRPVAWLIGALEESWIQVGDEEITARMGPLTRVEFPRRLVKDVRRIHWPWVFGIGIRIYGRRAAGLVGHRHDVVEIRLVHPVRIRAVVPMWIDRLAVSVAEPERLISLLGSSNEPAATTGRRPSTSRGARERRAAPRPSRNRAKRRPAA
jgi:hypothetical protein